MGSPKKQQPASSNVRVVARIRPLAKYEIKNGSKQIVNSLPSLTTNVGDEIQVPTEPEVLQVQPPPPAEKRWFELDAVLDGNSTQKEAYIKSGAQQAVTQDIFKGFNCTILAYGQTGAGKTFTMGSAAGSSAEIGEMDGIIPRACADLFHQIETRCDGNAQVELSYLEIYNEEMRDLLADNSKSKSNGKRVELKIRETLNGEVYVGGLSSRPVSSPKAIGEYMEEASQRRVVASTKMNAVSSRSHAICVLRIKGVLEDSTKFHAKLTLVDLAGSERIKKTGAEGGRRQEGININKGLFVLGQVVSALSETRAKYKRKPPYRDSKLTRLLQDSLGGNSRTIMVACVSPADFNLDETITTLRYATNARNIKNTATRNVIKSLSPEEAAKLQRENQLLQTQVKELQETIRKMAANNGSSPASSDPDDNDADADADAGEDPSSCGETTMSQQKERIKELENEVQKLKSASSASIGSSQPITESMAQDAIELPELKKKIATLEEEIAAKHDVEAENTELHEEVQNLKADADSARLAANKMSKIMEQLQALKGDEIDKKKLEHDHIKVEEAWVSFVFQVLQTNKEHLKKLQDDFWVVTDIVDSPEFMGLEERKGFISKIRKRIQGRTPRGGGDGGVIRSMTSSGHGNMSSHGNSSVHGKKEPNVEHHHQQQQQNTSDSNNDKSNDSQQQQQQQSNGDSNSGHHSDNKKNIQRTSSVDNIEETKQPDPDDPTNIMKIIVNLKDELKAAHEVIRQQRVQVELAMKRKDEPSQDKSTNDDNVSDDEQGESSALEDAKTEASEAVVESAVTSADSPTVPTSEYRKLRDRYTQLEIDRCWAEFQLRDRITNDALKFHRRIRAVMQKAAANSNGGANAIGHNHSNGGGSDAASVQEMEEEFKTKVDTELRSRLKTVADHLRVFEGRMVEMEKHVSAEMDSLGSIRNSLRVQRDEMELEIGVNEIEQHMLDKDDSDLLEQLTSLLVGPVKNLGTYTESTSLDEEI